MSGILILGASVLTLRAYGEEPSLSERDRHIVIDQVERAAAPWKGIDRLLIEYDTLMSPGDKGSISVPRVLAATTEGDLYFFGSHFSSDPWQVNVFAQEYSIHQGKWCFTWPFNRAYREGKINAGEALSGSIPEDLLLPMLPHWPLTQYKLRIEPSGTRILPVEALQLGEYRLISTNEIVQGETCVVFDCKNLDRLWIASRKGYCVMRRRSRHPYTDGIVEMQTDKLGEVAPGLWMPLQFQDRFFYGPDNRESTIVRVNVKRCLLNDRVPESTFTQAHAPGSILSGEGNQFGQTVTGGEDLLDADVAVMRTGINLPTAPIEHNNPYRSISIGLVGGLCAGFLYFSTGRRVATGKFYDKKSTHQEPSVTSVIRHKDGR
jgi:hypothetical protein